MVTVSVTLLFGIYSVTSCRSGGHKGTLGPNRPQEFLCLRSDNGLQGVRPLTCQVNIYPPGGAIICLPLFSQREHRPFVSSS